MMECAENRSHHDLPGPLGNSPRTENADKLMGALRSPSLYAKSLPHEIGRRLKASRVPHGTPAAEGVSVSSPGVENPEGGIWGKSPSYKWGTRTRDIGLLFSIYWILEESCGVPSGI